MALPGATAFFKNQSVEERGHAQKLIDYQNDRGGVVVLYELKVIQSNQRTCDIVCIQAPKKQEFGSLLEAFQDAVILEQANNQALLRLHILASDKNDPDVSKL